MISANSANSAVPFSGAAPTEINDVFDGGKLEGVTGPIVNSEADLDCCRKYGLLTRKRLNS